MKTRNALSVAMTMVTGALANAYVFSPESRSTQTMKASRVKQTEDPFAEVSEEGDGLLA